MPAFSFQNKYKNKSTYRFIENYNIFRGVRQSGRRGGVALYVKSELLPRCFSLDCHDGKLASNFVIGKRHRHVAYAYGLDPGSEE